MRLVICAVALGLLIAPASGAIAAPDTVLQPDETLLEVQADGQMRYAPDTAYITAGVVSTGTTATEATDANARTMAAVIAALKKAGVAARSIRTMQITVQPRFARQDPQDYMGQARITGYVAQNSVNVTIEKLTTAPDVIAAAFTAGANSVNGPILASADPHKGEVEARADALANAKAEATDFARGLCMKVARVLRVSERGNGSQPTSYARVGAVRGYAEASSPVMESPPVSAGELERRVVIWVDYALTPAGNCG